MKNKINISTRLKILLSVLLISIIWLGVTFALGDYLTWYRIPEKGFNIIGDLDKDVKSVSYWEDQKCIKVNNHNWWARKDFFTPTRTVNEWQKFQTWCNWDSDCSIEKATPNLAFHVIDTGWYSEDDDSLNGNPDYGDYYTYNYNTKTNTHHAAEPDDKEGSDQCDWWDPNRCYIFSHTCAMNSSWNVECWGDNKFWQIDVPDVLKSWWKAKWIYSWFWFNIALDTSWKIIFWWRNIWKLPNIPNQFDGWGVNIIWVWSYSACAVDESNNNKIDCWGPDWNLDNSPDWSNWQGKIAPVAFDFWVKDVWVWSYHVCIVRNDWMMWCWWETDHNKWQYTIPAWRDWSSWAIKQVSTWNFFTCALKESWELKCWGESYSSVPSWWDTWIKNVAAWARDVCALKENWAIKCWWLNQYHISDYKICEFNREVNATSNNCTDSSYWSDVYKSLGIGEYTLCWIKVNNTINCWGHKNKIVNSNIPPDWTVLYPSVKNFCNSEVFWVKSCWNWFVNSWEQCDDWNLVNWDWCESNCLKTPVCWDSIVSWTEECDDWNTANWDGCSSTCKNESSVLPWIEDNEPNDDSSCGNDYHIPALTWISSKVLTSWTWQSKWDRDNDKFEFTPWTAWTVDFTLSMDIPWVYIKLSDTCNTQSFDRHWNGSSDAWDTTKTWSFTISSSDTVYVTVWHENNTTKNYTLDLNFTP